MAQTEVLIIGCGIAGATAALRLAKNPNRKITIITRARDSHESNTRYAQGGIIGRGPDDSADLLYNDIIAAGAGVVSLGTILFADPGAPARVRHELLAEATARGFANPLAARGVANG